MYDLMECFSGAKCCTNLNSGYHQIRIQESDEWETTFKVKKGWFMPFGLINAPNAFMRLMKKVLKPYLDKFLVVYTR
jgi:hypothetical protein